jgi:hypothetical protein
MNEPRSSSRSAGVAALLLGLGSAFLFAAISRGVFVYGDDVLMYEVTEAIVERGEVAVTSAAPVRTATHSVEGKDGRRYAKYGIAPSLVAIPLYVSSEALFDRFDLPKTNDDHGNPRTGGRVFGTSLTNALVGGAAVSVACLLAIDLGASAVAALFASLMLGVGTLWAHYSATFLSEPLAGLCLVVSFWALVRFEKKAHTRGETAQLSWLAISGCAAGALVATKAAMLVAIVPLVGWAAGLSWRRGDVRGSTLRSLAWSLPLSAWLAGIGFYNWSRFGGAFATGYGKEGTNFTTPMLEGLSGLLLSPTKGIVWYSPILVFSLFGLFMALRPASRRAGVMALAISLLVLLVFGKYYQWYGGGAWGPRFLVPLLPLWMAFAALAFDRASTWRASARVAVAVVAIASLAATLAGVLLPFDDDPYFLVDKPREVRRVTWEIGRSPLLAHLEQLPGALAITGAKLATTDDTGSTGTALAASGVPDFAFVRYGSHALLQWTRALLLAAASALVAAAAAAVTAARAQKALLSRPPQ